ncbi:MAG: signal peptidase I [Bacillota bacterium]|nr:signal peptidase I [Bacillota bacterium]
MARATNPSGARPAKISVFEDYLRSIIASVILAALIMIFVGGSIRVDGSSMEPNFHDGERLIVDKVTYRFRPPARGEVVVLRWAPPDPRLPYIKRIIGLPGDRLELRDGQVILNGRPLEEKYIAEPARGEFGPYVVPPGHYFVLGDNRNHSEDSRFTAVGYIPLARISGRAVARYWPLTRLSLVGR